MGNAPRVTLEEVQAAIHEADYVVLPDGRTTICMLTLDNGFTVRGESSCVCVENFDAEIGKNIAYKDAQDKVWPLLGFRLADKLVAERYGPRYRDAFSGEYVTAEYAAANPDTTVREG
jgi:hypothetical protein